MALRIAAAVAVLWLVGLGQAVARADSVTFTPTGHEQTFTVPAGVWSVRVLAVGGHGGESAPTGPSGGISGGSPAQVSGTLAVTPGEVLYVEVGADGAQGSSGTSSSPSFNGGGAGGPGAGAGGGATDMRTSPLGSGLSPDTRLIVAAGGGGAGIGVGGGGEGGAADGAGQDSNGGGGHGGQPGIGTSSSPKGGAGGAPGGSAGALGTGGDGAASGTVYGGGGGGAGYTGGGGGGGGSFAGGSGGGGGGSSLPAPGGTIVVAASGVQPEVQLSYTPLQNVLSIVVAGAGHGTVAGTGVTCTTTCEQSFTAGTVVGLAATPAAGSAFAGWAGAGCSGTGPCTVAMTTDHAVVALFDRIPPPRCAIRPGAARRTGRGRRVAVVLAVRATCDQVAAVSLRGVLTQAGRPRTVVALGTVRGSVRPGRTTLLRVVIPGGAVRALARRVRESVALTLTGSGAGGRGIATARVARLRVAG